MGETRLSSTRISISTQPDGPQDIPEEDTNLENIESKEVTNQIYDELITDEMVNEDEGTEFNSDIKMLRSSSTSGSIFKIVMIRTGSYTWHNKNLFCGWYDSMLCPKGKQEIFEASVLLKNENYTFDLAYCSALNRCKESLDIILRELGLSSIEVVQSWELNERHCGGLTGYNQAELDAKYGQEQMNFWINSFEHAPPKITKEHKYYDSIYNNPLLPKNQTLPKTESLKSMQDRFKQFWNKHICPQILSGRRILLVTHNGGLQALVHYLDDIEFTNFTDTKIPRATPFYYKLDETLNPIYKDIVINNELERRIADAFEVFDHAGNKTVDMREIGTIIRSLGCVPTEAEIQEILVATENHLITGIKGSIHLAHFLPYMTKQIFEHKFQPASPDALLSAFRKIDIEGLGYVTKEQFTTLMMQEGEPFTEEEMEETLSIAVDPTTQTVPYEYYINQIMYDPDPENDIYLLADNVKAAMPRKSVRTTSQLLRAALEADEALGIPHTHLT